MHDDSLQQFCDDARAAGSVALDLEFETGQTYWPTLCLVQLATRDEIRLVDPFARGAADAGAADARAADARAADAEAAGEAGFAPLYELLADPHVEKIVHSGKADLQILYRRTGLAPRHIFDTQLAAALLGMGDQVGYGPLVGTLLGVTLRKSQTRSNWTRRPLSAEQVQYAEDDVRYLHPLRDALQARLAEKGRLSWLAEATAVYEDGDELSIDPRESWQRFRTQPGVTPRLLALLRELAAWREITAEATNVPPRRLVSDEVLNALARQAPAQVPDLSEIRGLPAPVIEAHGTAILRAIATGIDVPDRDCPAPLTNGPTLDRLRALLTSRAAAAEVAPSCIANKSDLAALMAFVEAGESPNSPAPLLLSGWRRTFIGEDLRAIVRADRAVANPETG